MWCLHILIYREQKGSSKTKAPHKLRVDSYPLEDQVDLLISLPRSNRHKNKKLYTRKLVHRVIASLMDKPMETTVKL